MLNVSLVRSYRSKNGNKTFVYKVSGSKEALKAYAKSQGDFLRKDDEGNALWFTTRCIGDRGTLIITSNGKVTPDMSAYDQAASLASQYGGDLGAELAKAAAAKLLGTAPPAQSADSASGDDDQVGDL